MNQIVLTGRLGQDAETSYTDSGTPVVRFSIAVQRNRDVVDWMNVSYFGENAEKISGWLTKGRLIGINGSLETYKRRDGNGTGFSVVARNVEFLDKKPEETREPEPAVSQAEI